MKSIAFSFVMVLLISCDSIERNPSIDKKINSEKKSDTSQEQSKNSLDTLLVQDSTNNNNSVGNKEIDSVEVTIVDIQDEFEYVDQLGSVAPRMRSHSYL